MKNVVLPNGWQIKKMPEVVTWGSGGTPKATEKTYYQNGTIPWLIIGDLNDGIITSSANKITEKGLNNSSAKMIPPSTLLIAMYGSIGKLGITGISCCCNQAIAFAKELHGVTTKYMFYYMALIKSKLISLGKGGTQKNISQTVLNSLDVIVPPLPEQERIVARIEEMFSQLDNGVETLKKSKQQLAVYRQAVLKEAFEVCIKHKTIEEVCSHVTDGDHFPPPKSVNGVPFIMISNIKNNRIVWDNTNYVDNNYYSQIGDKRTPKKGDVFYTVTGSYGIPVLVDFNKNFCFQRHIALLRPNGSILQKFLYYALQTPNVYQQATDKATGTAQKTVALSVLRKITIPYCNIKQQEKIVFDVEKQISLCKSIENNIDSALQQAEALRQSILKKAFEGGNL